MMSRTRTERVQHDLTAMCELFVYGATLIEVCRRTDCSITTIRARSGILKKAGVKLSTRTRNGRGYGTKVYFLNEPIEIAKEKVTARYEKKDGPKSEIKKQPYQRDSSGKSGRGDGWGIESWFFMDSTRARAYVKWCDSWTVKE